MELISQIALGVIIGGLTIALLVMGFYFANFCSGKKSSATMRSASALSSIRSGAADSAGYKANAPQNRSQL
jgi:hypothetical protein